VGFTPCPCPASPPGHTASMDGRTAWNNLLSKAWGEEPPEPPGPTDELACARGFTVRAAKLRANKRVGLGDIPEGEEEVLDGPTEGDLELRKLLAEWDEEDLPPADPVPAHSGRPGLDPAMERKLGAEWLHEHVIGAGLVERPRKPESGGPANDIFSGAFRAAAREEAHAWEEATAGSAVGPNQAASAQVEQKEEASAIKQAYILPVHDKPSDPEGPEQNDIQVEEGKRPERDLLHLMDAWSDKKGESFDYKPELRKPPAPTAYREKKSQTQVPEDALAKEMREAVQASPLLGELRVQMARDKIVQAPAEYRSFAARLKAANGNIRRLASGLRNLPVAGVADVPRAKSAPDPLKVPVVVESRRGWRPKSFTQAFWSYECGEASHKCFLRYPPAATEKRPARGSTEVRIDSFSKYAGVIKERDPACLEERGLAYPRFFIGGWCPFNSSQAGRDLWMEDWKSGRQLWAPPGVKDLTHRWVKMCCAGAGLPLEGCLANFDRVQMGPPGAITRLHVENNAAHAWFAQIQGKRAFILFSPQDRENLYPESAWPERCSEECYEHSPIDVFHPNERMYPKFRESKAQVAILEPGETLVLPQGWWHYSVALETCVTLHRRFWNRVNRSSIHEEFPNLVAQGDLEGNMRDVFFNHVEGCRRTIAQDDSSDEDDDPRM